MTQPANDSEYATTQRWYIQGVNASDRQWEDFHGRIVQASSQLYLNAYVDAKKDNQVYLSSDGSSDDTIWVFEHINESPIALLDGVFTIQQESSGKYLDADNEVWGGHSSVMSYTKQADFSSRQQFILRRVKGEVYTITHLSSGRLLGAHVFEGDMNATVFPELVSVGTSQQWMMVYLKYNTFLFQHILTGRILGEREYNASAGLIFGCMPSLAMYDGNVSDVNWKVTRVGFAPLLKGIYRIRNKLTQRYLLADSQSRNVTTKIVRSDSSEDHFAIAFLAGDTYEVYADAAKRVMEVGPSNEIILGEFQHVPIVQTSLVQSDMVPLEAADNPKEQWFLVWAGGHDYYFAQPQKNHHKRYLTDAGGTVHLAKYNEEDSQIWTVEKADSRCFSKRTHCPAIYKCGIIDDWCGSNVTCTSESSDANGTCTGVNTVTGIPYECHEADHLCHCLPKSQCSSGACGIKQDDGCGGVINCAPCPPPAPPSPAPAAVIAAGPAAFVVPVAVGPNGVHLDHVPGRAPPVAVGPGRLLVGPDGVPVVGPGGVTVHVGPGGALVGPDGAPLRAAMGPDGAPAIGPDGVPLAARPGAAPAAATLDGLVGGIPIAPGPGGVPLHPGTDVIVVAMAPAPAAAPGAVPVDVSPPAVQFTAPAPAPMPFAWQPLPTSTTMTTTTCLTKCSTPGWECGFQPDGCGGLLPCGTLAGACPTHPLNSTGASFSCGLNHTCACVRRTKCDVNTTCGVQSDGCGGSITCGQANGNCTGGDQYKCEENRCKCVPETCQNRCGAPIPDGCGNHIQCSCTMANERCNRAAGRCEHVAGPTPDPSIFASTTTNQPPASSQHAEAQDGANAANATNATNTNRTIGGAPSPQAAPSPVGAPSPAVFVPPVVSTPPPGVPPTTPKPLGLNPDIVGYYTYFYYIYYYFSYLRQKSAGRSDLEAAATAQKIAPVYAYEQLRYTLGFNITSSGLVPPANLPPLPPTGAALLEKAPAMVSTLQQGRIRIDRDMMEKLIASSGMSLRADETNTNILPKAVDISMLQAMPTSRNSAFLRHQRSALRGAVLGTEGGDIT